MGLDESIILSKARSSRELRKRIKSVVDREDKGKCTGVAIGYGDSYGSITVVESWAFYQPNGSVDVYELMSERIGQYGKIMITRQDIQDSRYSRFDFGEHLRQYKIKLGEKMSLSDFVKGLEG